MIPVISHNLKCCDESDHNPLIPLKTDLVLGVYSGARVVGVRSALGLGIQNREYEIGRGFFKYDKTPAQLYQCQSGNQLLAYEISSQKFPFVGTM